MPLTIALSSSTVGKNTINLQLTMDGKDIDGPSITVTDGRESGIHACVPIYITPIV